jgi:hypothetical protein
MHAYLVMLGYRASVMPGRLLRLAIVVAVVACHRDSDRAPAPSPPPVPAVPAKPARPLYILGKVIAPDTHKVLWSFDDTQVTAIANDESLLAIADPQHRIVVRRLVDGQIAWTRAWPDRPDQLALTPAGLAIVDGSRLTLLSRSDGSDVHATELGERPHQVSIGGAMAAVTMRTSIVFVELATGHTRGVIAMSDHPVQDIDLDDVRRRFGSAASNAPLAQVSRPPQTVPLEDGFVVAESQADEHPSTHVIVIAADGHKQLDARVAAAGLNAPELTLVSPRAIGLVTVAHEPWAQLIRLQPSVRVEPPLSFYVDSFVGDEPLMLRVEPPALVATAGTTPRFRVADAFPTWDDNHVLASEQVDATIVACAYATAEPDTVLLGIDAATGAVRYRVSLATSKLWARRPFELRAVTVERAADSVIVTREEIDGIVVDLVDAKTGQTWYHDEHAWH